MIAPRPIERQHDTTPLRDYFSDVYCPSRTEEFSNATREVYRAAFSRLGKCLGRPSTIADLTSETIASFLLWIISLGRSPGTANSYRNSILAMWRFAREQGHIDEWPDMSIIREYRSYNIEEHRAEKAAAEAPQPLSPQMTLRAFLPEYARKLGEACQVVAQTRWAVISLDKMGFEPTRLEQLTDQLIDEWVQQRLDAGIGDQTIRQQRSFVLRLWQTSADMGLVSTRPQSPIPSNRQRCTEIIGNRQGGKEKATRPTIAPLDVGAIIDGEQVKISGLIGSFINWQEGRIKESRKHGLRFYLSDFERAFGHLTIGEFRKGAPARVDAWLKSHKGWVGCKATVVSHLKQMFGWGATGPRNSQGFYVSSPIASLERPKHGKRMSYFTAEQVDAILRNSPPQFATAFRALLATGCRPNEVGSLTADDVEQDEDGLYWLVHHKNEHHSGEKRRIYLTAEAEAITREQMRAFPTGRLFRSDDNANPDGNLSRTYFNHTLRKICRKSECRALGLDKHQMMERTNGTPWRLYKYVAYTCRHTFAVRYLTGFFKDAAGNPIILGYAEIAQYLGNSAAVTEKIYGHLVEQRSFLRTAARHADRPTDAVSAG